MLYAIIPAAGIGSRMQSSTPKQYLPLLDGNVLLYSVRALLALSEVQLLLIVLHPDDRWWPQTAAMLQPDEQQRIQTCFGGAERWQSVQAALSVLSSIAEAGAWVMVHDAVRPCVRVEDLRALLQTCMSSAVSETSAIQTDGALLASPVSDTIKKADSSFERLGTTVAGSVAWPVVASTIDRSHLWAACTPQLFPIGVLQQALARAAFAGITITDEASAMEFCGARPALVSCSKDNIKITYPEDLDLASWILKSRARKQESRNKQQSLQPSGDITQ